MNILAIDTSCDDSCAAILDAATWRLRSDVVHSHIDAMKKYGGVVPEIASREHLRGLPLAVDEALRVAGISAKDLNWIAATNRPGLVGALLVGVSFAKAMAMAVGAGFTALNHVEAHLFSPLLTTLEGGDAPPFPWIGVVVSGGHSEIFFVENTRTYRWLGGTLDDAAGEAFDKVGKLVGLDYPAGPVIDRWVRESATPEQRTEHAFPRAKTEGYHLSYSGLKTAVALHVKRAGRLSKDQALSIIASSQEAILDTLIEKARLAQSHWGAKSIVVTGGVACNSRLREKMPEAYYPLPRHCSDNAAMVALLAALSYREGTLRASDWGEEVSPQSNFPT